MKAAILTILAVLALSVPVMAQDQRKEEYDKIWNPYVEQKSFYLSKEDEKEAFKRMRAMSWENVVSTHSFEENNPLLRAVVEDDEFTYFAFIPGPLPVVYMVKEGVDHPVIWSYLEELHAIAVKNKADTWVVRHGDKYVVATKKAAQ